MMYAFGARRDCDVWDEPFYAAYLAETRIDHPMRAETIAAGETDPHIVGQRCGQIKDRRMYLKLMAHHMVWGLEQDWFDAVTHCILIRHPLRVLASYAKKRENPTLSDVGFVQLTQIYDALLARGHRPIVVDSYDIRAYPEGALRALCAMLGMPFDPAMLSWKEGGHPDDGVWAPHWYGAVHRSTGFSGPEGALPDVPDSMLPILEEAMPHYTRLKALSLCLSKVPT
jgi:hypothetical protein